MSQSTTEFPLPLDLSHPALEEEKAAPAAPVVATGPMSDFLVLTKARLSFLVVVTAFVGACMAAPGPISWLRMLHAVVGTTLAAFAAAVLNQVVEARVDRLMERTRQRPIPAGRVTRRQATLLGFTLGTLGCAQLFFFVNGLSAALAAATVAIYVLLYTPLKRRTSFCTVVGAVAGAIPPMIGWTAMHPHLDFGAWVLFGILFTWQMPHFLALAWMYRDEYAQAGFVMLQRDDHTGTATATHSLVYTLALGLISVFPFAAGFASSNYLAGALALDSMLLLFAIQFLMERDRGSARSLFLASIGYLPLLLGLMVCGKV